MHRNENYEMDYWEVFGYTDYTYPINQNTAKILFRGNFGEFVGWYRDDYQKLKNKYLTIRYHNMMYPDSWRYFKYYGEEDKDRIEWWNNIYP